MSRKKLVLEIDFCLGFYGSTEISETLVFKIKDSAAEKWLAKKSGIEPWSEGDDNDLLNSFSSLVKKALPKSWKIHDGECQIQFGVGDTMWATAFLKWRGKQAWEGYSPDSSVCSTPPDSLEMEKRLSELLHAGFGEDSVLLKKYKGGLRGLGGIREAMACMSSLEHAEMLSSKVAESCTRHNNQGI